jgi:hypothetical protein
MATAKVDNAQSSMPQPRMITQINSGSVRPAMMHGPQHGIKNNLLIFFTLKINNTGNTAHKSLQTIQR